MQEIDPRLRDTSAGSFSQRPSGITLPTSIAANVSRSPGTPHQYPPPHDESPHQNIYTPRSVNLTDHDGGDGTHDDGPNDPKRPRACEACRGLKVRCEPDPNNLDGPCKRCAKANRNCVVTVPSRKRQKKTDSRVAELEKKIDALTASLQASKSASGSAAHGSENGLDHEALNAQTRPNPYQQVTNGGYVSPFVGRPDGRINSNEWTGFPKAPEFHSRKASAPPMVVAGQKRKHFESRNYSTTSESPSSIGGIARKSVDSSSTQHHYGLGESIAELQKPPQTHEYADVVDKGEITVEMATQCFNCYVEKMAPHMPAVVFPPGTTAAEVRKTKPTLFLAIISAASGSQDPKSQRKLTKEVMSIFAERIICNGEKTLELIQALHVSTLWYWPPEHFEELKFYQLIHIAAVMAIDIGMGKKSKTKKTRIAELWRDHPWRRTPYPDPETTEARRAWLASYFMCCNASMGLRRPNLIRWTPFMDDCVDFLENSPEALPSDKVLCQWVRSQHIAEEIGTQFSMDDSTAKVSIGDSKVQYALKGFERDLEKWSSQIPPDVQSPSLKITEHVVNLYMHEVAMHVDHNVEEFKPPFSEETLDGGVGESGALTPSHIGALSTCLTSIDGIFETFLRFDIETVRCLPVAQFVRVAYAVVVLIKMYFAAATPNSELGKVINKDNMKVEQYLDGLVEIFKASAAEEKSRPSAKFLMVLIMLKTWFNRQREGKGTQPGPQSFVSASSPGTLHQEALAETPSESHQNARQNAQQRQQPGFSPANTPLQLLSEVATGNSGQSRSEGNAMYPPSNEWYPTQPQRPYTPGYDPMNPLAPLPQAYTNVGMSGNIDPSLGIDLGYAMGDGFEQAMGMTLGVGDFGTYFGDDIFGSLMDSVGGNPQGFEGF